MKTKEYVEKYKLNLNDKFNHSAFTADLTIDFISLLELGNAKENVKGFNNAVNAIKSKWDAINNKTVGQLPGKLWNYFYATVICKMRDEMFPEIKEKRERKQREWERRQREEASFLDDFFEDMFYGFIGKMVNSLRIPKPIEAFNALGISSESSIEDVKLQYRKLSKVHHPDMGGDRKSFEQITEAKNKLISYFKSNG